MTTASAPEAHAAAIAPDRLIEIAERFGTPSYVYDAAAIDAGVARWVEVAGGADRIWFAVKANANRTVLARMLEAGLGLEVSTAGEVARARAAGAVPERIMFGGVPKRDDELLEALGGSLDLVILQAPHEVALAAATSTGTSPAVGLRVRPGIRAGAHPSLETAVADAKFGLLPDELPALWERLSLAPDLRLSALAVHLGSGVDSLEPYGKALDLLLGLCDQLGRVGEPVRELDLGGGLAVRYGEETPPEPAELAELVRARIGDRPLAVRFEPGRSIVARSGLLLTRVLYASRRSGSRALVCDAAFSDFGRYVLYGAEHRIMPVAGTLAGPPDIDVLGASCETGDVLGTGRSLHGVERGDLLAVLDVGAYGMAMASNYNGRRRAPEILVEDGEARVIRRRETEADFARLEP